MRWIVVAAAATMFALTGSAGGASAQEPGPLAPSAEQLQRFGRAAAERRRGVAEMQAHPERLTRLDETIAAGAAVMAKSLAAGGLTSAEFDALERQVAPAADVLAQIDAEVAALEEERARLQAELQAAEARRQEARQRLEPAADREQEHARRRALAEAEAALPGLGERMGELALTLDAWRTLQRGSPGWEPPRDLEGVRLGIRAAGRTWARDRCRAHLDRVNAELAAGPPADVPEADRADWLDARREHAARLAESLKAVDDELTAIQEDQRRRVSAAQREAQPPALPPGLLQLVAAKWPELRDGCSRLADDAAFLRMLK